jgi:toxin ParE1/3/4
LSSARLTEAAIRDLIEIGAWIAIDNPDRARRFVTEIESFALSLGTLPRRYAARSALGPGIRLAPFRGYNVIYRVLPDAVRIERVLHGARDIARVSFDP